MSFTYNFIKEILINLSNDYKDNYDFYRFGVPIKSKIDFSMIKEKIKNMLKNKKFIRLDLDNIICSLSIFEPYMHGFENLYYLLNDDRSKELLIKILAYRILGFKKVKLPTNTQEFWEKLEYLEKLANKNDFIHVNFNNWKLYKFDLQKLGYPLSLYYTSIGIFLDFILKQYEYRGNDILIKVVKDNIIIDAGGCWGDTALYFAYEAGDNGKVYTFEFISSNLEIMKKNFSYNVGLQKNIQIIENPLWSESNKEIYYIDNGPSSRVSLEKIGEKSIAIKTLSIDDWVKKNNLGKIDFIKMDIEGAELQVLHGALNTINKFKPDLAIALYHNLSDFINIPSLINSLNLPYKFYLGHYTIHAEETVLFASVKH